MGQDAPSLYLLICDPAEMDAVLADMAAEVQIQLGLELRAIAASTLRPETLEALTEHNAGQFVVIALAIWLPELISSLDRNIVLLTSGGAVALLTSSDIAEHVLISAPNLRNRLTDVLVFRPDEVFGDSRA